MALLLLLAAASAHAAPAPPSDLVASDAPADTGDRIRLQWKLSPDDVMEKPKPITGYKVVRATEESGPYDEVALAEPNWHDYRAGRMTFDVEKCQRGEDYYLGVSAVAADGSESTIIAIGPVRPVRQIFDGRRLWLAIFAAMLCGSVIYWILHARAGRPVKVRKIAGLEAIEEAVGRATEMGRSCMFIPGTMDMNDMQTIAGLTVLSRVAQTAAEYGTRVEVPTSRSLVMTAARETMESAYLAAGRPDAYREDDAYYVTDEQFGYVAYLTGAMVRQKPAACFYMGAFYAEALIIAETGNAVGAIQVAGTAMPSQLPFFVAACDYTLIGEEFFAASAYLSGEPAQLGSLKGQDLGKLVAGIVLLGGCGVATVAAVTASPALLWFVDYLKKVVLQ